MGVESTTKDLEPEVVKEELRVRGSITGAAQTFGVTRRALSKWLVRHGIDADEVIGREKGSHLPRKPNILTVGASHEDLGDVTKLIRRRGLKPIDFEVDRIRLNEWGKCGECGADGLEQNRVDLVPRRDLLVPVRSDGWIAPRKGKVRPSEGRIALLPDQHAPMFDPGLHVALCEWIKEAKPSKIVCLGDLLDNASVSRYRQSGFEPTLKECTQGGYNLLRGYAKAVESAGMAVARKPGDPGVEIVWVLGNHDLDRLLNSLRDRGHQEIANLPPVLRNPDDPNEVEEPPLLRFENVMRLDELGVQVVHPPPGFSYDHAEYRVTDDLLAVHGWKAKKGSGASARATLEEVGENVVQGHCHRQGIVFHTMWVRNEQRRLAAMECGTLGLLQQSALGHARRPDWQGGWGVAETFSGAVSFDLATAVGKQVLWRDSAFSM